METREQKILQQHLAQFIIGDVFNTITEDDLLQVKRSRNPLKGDVWTHKGHELPHSQVELLKAQAKSLKESELWKLLKNELLWHAQNKGLYKSQTTEDIISTKVLLYLIDVIDSKLESMSQ